MAHTACSIDSQKRCDIREIRQTVATRITIVPEQSTRSTVIGYEEIGVSVIVVVRPRRTGSHRRTGACAVEFVSETDTDRGLNLDKGCLRKRGCSKENADRNAGRNSHR
jgi:hypothetical protein